jgi:flagellar basal body-associated protein FliL
VQNSKVSQKKPMTVWCVLVFTLVAIFVAIGFAMFYMPARTTPVEQRSTVPAASQ